MCTLILYHRSREDWPLVIAANRDERLDRQAVPPRELNGKTRIWAGIDREAGGTWLGVNALGLVVGLTNTARSARDPERRSRGLLVMDLLKEPDAETAARRLEALPPRDYNPCQIVVADPRRAFLCGIDERPRVEELPAGVHILTNAAPGEPEEPRRAEVVRLLGVDGAAESKSIEDLKRILSRHAPVPERSVCMHRPNFGTRSASLIAVGGRRAPLYLHAEGPPCRVPWQDLSPERGAIRVPAAPRATSSSSRPAASSSPRASAPARASAAAPSARSAARPSRSATSSSPRASAPARASAAPPSRPSATRPSRASSPRAASSPSRSAASSSPRRSASTHSRHSASRPPRPASRPRRVET